MSKTMFERAMSGETVTVAKVAAGTTITQGAVNQVWEAFYANQPFILMDAEPSVETLAQSYLDKPEEDWTWVDPEDIKRLARAVLDK